MKRKITICTFVVFILLCCACSNENNNTPNNTNTNPAPQQTTGSQTPSSQTSKSSIISKEAALSIALEHAGLNMEQVSHIKSSTDKNERIKHYDVEFYSFDNKEYDYEIAIDTGEILEWDVEPIYD